MADTVLARLRDNIVRGELRLGELLSERVLAEQLGLSKTPVREALAQLRLEGLVRIVPQRGAFVFTLSAAELTALCEFRSTLETAALQHAMRRAPDELSRDLANVLVDMEKALNNSNRTAYLDADTAFHEVFFTHCGNSYLSETYQLHIGKIAALRTHLATKPFHTEKSFVEHQQILDCTRAGDLGGALGILDKHIARTKLTYGNGIKDIAAADRAQQELSASKLPGSH